MNTARCTTMTDFRPFVPTKPPVHLLPVHYILVHELKDNLLNNKKKYIWNTHIPISF